MNVKMKQTIRYILLMVIPLVMAGVLITSCDEDEATNGGKPIVHYVRNTDVEKSDSLYAGAFLGGLVAIIGDNLENTKQIFFNDQEAELIPTYITNKSIIVNVPADAPEVVNNMMTLIFADGTTLEYPFEVNISAPEIVSMQNEYAFAGEVTSISGNYFFEPITVTFTGGATAEVMSVEQTEIQITIPEGAEVGPVTISTNFGETESTFYFRDNRNIILNFDDKVANGWRIGLVETGDGPVDGNYLVIRGDIAANQRDEGPGAPSESPFAMEYWGGNDASREGNFYPLYPGSYKEYVLKFEAKVKKWYGGHLNLCLSTPDHTGNNQEIWGNDLNARAIWAPWSEEDAEFTTGDTWMTVVIPMTEFQYSMGSGDDGVFYTPGLPFIETNVGSLSTWFLGSPENTGNAVEFYIDNIRFVEP